MVIQSRTFYWLLIIVMALGLGTKVFAEEKTPDNEIAADPNSTDEQKKDIFDMSLEELMEMKVASTASLTSSNPRLVPATASSA